MVGSLCCYGTFSALKNGMYGPVLLLDLHKLGGLTAVIRELNNPNPEVRAFSAWILGKASQNNPSIQNQIVKLGALPKLIEMVRPDFIEEATKAFYAVSALIRNNIEGQEYSIWKLET